MQQSSLSLAFSLQVLKESSQSPSPMLHGWSFFEGHKQLLHSEIRKNIVGLQIHVENILMKIRLRAKLPALPLVQFSL